MKTFRVLTLIAVLSSSAYSAEADHYTHSDTPMVDIAEIVNARANAYLKLGLEKANEGSQCDDSVKSEKALYEELRNYFANHGRGRLVQEILQDKDIPKREIPKGESIYSDWVIEDGFLLGRPGAASSQLGLMPLIRIGTQDIGVDKLEHMFGMGLIYHKQHNIDGRDLTSVLRGGIFREKTTLGGNRFATGVFAYADLAANFNGMRFWNHILQKRDDVLGKKHNIGPYAKCEAGTWTTTDRAIDFREYVDPSMDESINCRKFATQGGYDKSIAAMEQRGLDGSACPRERLVLYAVKTKYDVPVKGNPRTKISHWIINEEGLGKVKYFREFK